MEDSYEYIESIVADSRQGLVLQLGGLGDVVTTLHTKNWPCYESDTYALCLD
jgi:hypothetical protein